MCTNSSGLAERTRASMYVSCALCHILVLPKLSSAGSASAITLELALLEIFRQAQHVLRRHLGDHILCLAIDYLDDHAAGLRIPLKDQVALPAEHFGFVQSLDGLHHFAVFN